VVRWTSRGFGHHTVKAETPQIEGIDKSVNDTDRVVLTDPIVQAFGKQGGLAAIHAFDKASHRIPQTRLGDHTIGRVLTLPRSKKAFKRSRVRVCSLVNS
jgi:hypothetical protein